MPAWAKLGELGFADLAKVTGIAAGDIEKAAAASERAAASTRLSEAAQDAVRIGGRKPRGGGAKPEFSDAEINQSSQDMGIGWIYKGSSEADVKLSATRTAEGLTLQAPKDHEFEMGVHSNIGYANKATRLADGSTIFEHPDKGIAAPEGSRKLHIGVNADDEHFVKAIGEPGLGIYGPDRATEIYWKSFGKDFELGKTLHREVYASPTTVHIAEDVSLDHAVHVITDERVNAVKVVQKHPENGVVEHWFDLEGKSIEAPKS